MKHPHAYPVIEIYPVALWPNGTEAWKETGLLIGAGQVPVWREESMSEEQDAPVVNTVPLAPHGAQFPPQHLILN